MRELSQNEVRGQEEGTWVRKGYKFETYIVKSTYKCLQGNYDGHDNTFFRLM